MEVQRGRHQTTAKRVMTKLLGNRCSPEFAEHEFWFIEGIWERCKHCGMERTFVTASGFHGNRGESFITTVS